MLKHVVELVRQRALQVVLDDVVFNLEQAEDDATGGWSADKVGRDLTGRVLTGAQGELRWLDSVALREEADHVRQRPPHLRLALG